MAIHPTAIVHPETDIDPTASVGAYAVVERDVRIGPETQLYPHAYVSEGTTLGARCQIHPFAVVGHLPQDLKYEQQPSYTLVGDETIIREHASVHRGTAPGSTTVVGRRCFIMATAHVGHNCVVGDDVKIANSGLLSGHVHVGNGTFISGNAAVHQFVRIGALVMVGGGLRVTQDIPPFMMLGPQGVVGPNVIGLRRAGLSPEERQELRICYHLLYRSDIPFFDAARHVVSVVKTEPGRRLAEFLQERSKRGYMPGRRRQQRRSIVLEESP
jgi:UDP-N-acetylglucosamine acyltransferase